MNRLTAKLMRGLMGVACVVGTPYALANGPVTVLTNLQITGPGIPTASGWKFGGSGLSVAQTTPPPVSGDPSYALEGQYPAVGFTGETSAFADFYVSSLNTESIYIDFWAKMPDAKEGLKFCKIFGMTNDPIGYANTTFMTDYTGIDQGGLLIAEYGDGTNTQNDSQDAIRLTGPAGSMIGRSYGTAVVMTPQMKYWTSSDWGTGWHHFRIHVKFNSGTTSSNAVPDGKIYLEIDGKVYINATGLYNRNPGDGPIERIGLFGWAGSDPQSFDVWYDNIVISTGGFASDPAPAAMAETVQ